MEYKTIESVVQDGLCTGCGTCVAVCPEAALKMEIDSKRGIYLPRLESEQCADCGLCVKVCPGHVVDFNKLNLEIFGRLPDDIHVGNYLGCYIGHATDYDIRYHSASGGLVTSLLIFALEKGMINGALVTRMHPDRPLEPQPFIAKTKDEIVEAARSKYCPVPANIALREILKAPKGEQFAVVGLPCHIHGLRKAEIAHKELGERIGLRLGLFCSINNNFHMTEFILRRHNIALEDVTRIEYRGHGWPGCMSIYLKDGIVISIPYNTYIRFHQFWLFTTRRCTLCGDMSSEMADISFGDAWIPEIHVNDQTGTSLIIARNKLAEDLITLAIKAGVIAMREINSTQAVSSAGDKRANLGARLILNRIVGKKTPSYNTDLRKPLLITYPFYLFLYFHLYLSSKRVFWRIIGILRKLENIILPDF